jgi:hypothetical protein
MTTEERPERTQDESGRTKRRTHPLISLCVWLFGKEGGLRVLEAGYERVMIVLGVVLIGAAGLLFWVVWASMEPSEPSNVDLMKARSEAQRRADIEMGGEPVPKARDAKAIPGNLLETTDPEVLKYMIARDHKAAEYYAPTLARAQGMQREAATKQKEAATKAMLVPAAAGVMCFVLAFVSFRARLIAAGIVLLGLTAVYATFLVAKKDVGESEAALYILVIAVAGLSGLVCAALGMVRFLATSKGALP